MNNPTPLLVPATNALTGSTKYFSKADLRQDSYDIFKASSSLPFLCSPYMVNWIPYYDGALGDPVPIEKAFQWGCDRVVLILSRPTRTPRAPGKDAFFASRIQRKYPFAANKLRTRVERYNRCVALAKEYEAQGRALIIAPDDLCGMDTLTRDKEAMVQFYQKGYEEAKKISSFM